MTWVFLVLSPSSYAIAQEPRSRRAQEATAAPLGPADYQSQHFLIHTDLPPGEANELLERLETMLGLISDFWSRPPQGMIECYVVRDLANWPANSLHPVGQAAIENRAGITITAKIRRGNVGVAKSVVYAVADRGTPQHESVHAYCGQNFGTTGPVWYSEGMAEMGQYWRKGLTTVNCRPEIVEYLRASPTKSLNEIVNGNEVTGDSWQNYAWRWALCHLLANNPNYSDKFRPLRDAGSNGVAYALTIVQPPRSTFPLRNNEHLGGVLFAFACRWTVLPWTVRGG